MTDILTKKEIEEILKSNLRKYLIEVHKLSGDELEEAVKTNQWNRTLRIMDANLAAKKGYEKGKHEKDCWLREGKIVDCPFEKNKNCSHIEAARKEGAEKERQRLREKLNELMNGAILARKEYDVGCDDFEAGKIRAYENIEKLLGD